MVEINECRECLMGQTRPRTCGRAALDIDSSQHASPKRLAAGASQPERLVAHWSLSAHAIHVSVACLPRFRPTSTGAATQCGTYPPSS